MKNIKGSVHQFVTRAAKAVWPEKRSMKRLGVLVFGICALLGVSQASNVQKMLSGLTEGNASTQNATSVVAKPTPTAEKSAPVEAQTEITEEAAAPNIVDLISESELIFRGTVKEVTDGFENSIPYTQVTIRVTEAFRGQTGEEYTFRQFGLIKPRSMGNGKVYMGVTPDGWAKYEVGEDTMLFLYQAASMTGLRTTVGLGQGKVNFKGGNAQSQFGNDGLFRNVNVDSKLLNDKDQRLLGTEKGVVNAEGFEAFVRRAVSEKWVEGRKMRHAKK